MRISSEGIATFVGLGLFAAVLGAVGYGYENPVMIVLFYVSLILFVFSIYFFRDPERTPPDDPDAILSPADGRIIAIDETTENKYIGESVKRVSIFLSVFNVHVNRIPFAGQVDYMDYRRGQFLPAYRPEASEANQYMFVGLETGAGKIAFKQSAGILARRIVCHLRIGDQVTAGARFGIIKFGSRMEIFMPLSAKVVVKVGDRVRAGENIIGKLNEA